MFLNAILVFIIKIYQILMTHVFFHAKAMPNWNFVKRQLKFDKPRYLFTKTHTKKRKHNYFTTKIMHYIYMCILKKTNHHNMKQWFNFLRNKYF